MTHKILEKEKVLMKLELANMEMMTSLGPRIKSYNHQRKKIPFM